MPKQLHEAFVERIKTQFADSADFLEAISRTPYYSVRFNTAKPSNCDISLSSQVDWCPDAYYVEQRPNYTLNPKFHSGAFYPQEASSMYLYHVLTSISQYIPESPIVLDLCAAPGGKSTLISSFLKGRGLLVANEVIRNRAWILRENVVKWGYPNTIVTNVEPSTFGNEGAMFDLLLIDAPCSGEGMFRKDDVAVQEWSPENAQMCASRQRQIISDVWDAVVEDGIVIYSTCTFNPAENEQNMRWIANEFDVEFLQIPIPENSAIVPVTFEQGEGYGFYPNKVKGEGFFICAMRKLSGRVRRLAKDKNKISKAVAPRDLLINDSSFDYFSINDKIIAMPRDVCRIMLQIQQQYRPLWCGIELGEQTRKDFMPSPELPLSIAFNINAFAQISLTQDNALHYLRGEWTTNQMLNSGWNVVSFDQLPLGFVKAIGNRVNNYYPKEWRIRIQL